METERAFAELALPAPLLAVVGELGFDRLTPIQAEAIPLLLEGRDVIAQARTGSGKTAAFVLPLLARVELPRRAVQALVLCPTRELCAQVARETRRLGRRLPGLRVTALAGGQPMGGQLAELRHGPHVVVGTPGRLLDHLGRGSLVLEDARFLVLDEADRMLEMGFREEMERILEALPAERQTAFFSATYPRAIEALSAGYQRDPVRVTPSAGEEGSPDASVAGIRQQFREVDGQAKPRALLALLEETRPRSAIVFCNLKATVAELERELRGAGIAAAGLHGDLEQADRDRVMAKFRNSTTPILVATDVAARGIDVADLDVVFCYDLPSRPEVYVHRIGRTGRAGRQGRAISLGSARERGKLAALESATGGRIEILEASTRPAEAGSRVAPPALASDVVPMETLFISGGRKEKVRPGDILGALTGEAAGLPASLIGKIEIHDRFAYVAVAREVAEKALACLRDGRIKGRRFRVERVR